MFGVRFVVLLKFQSVIVLHVRVLLSLVSLVERKEVLRLNVLDCEAETELDLLLLLLLKELLLLLDVILLIKFSLLFLLFDVRCLEGGGDSHFFQVEFGDSAIVDFFFHPLRGLRGLFAFDDNSNRIGLKSSGYEYPKSSYCSNHRKSGNFSAGTF